MDQHRRYMLTALSLAQRHLGQTWPNPTVGAILVKNGQIIAQGITARTGRPHAETEALQQARAEAKGATLYVTLEPCSHHGKTPPCTQAIIQAGIATVVIACRDPNPLVNGQGIRQLTDAGIEVIENICQQEAIELNRGFFSAIEKKRPFISLKLATSLDGKVATATGESKWITGERARNYGHYLRSRYDAIATGIGTVLADNPSLTCRLPGLEDHSPVRIVFDSKARLPLNSRLVKTAKDMPVWILTHCHSRAGGNLLPPHVKILQVDTEDSRLRGNDSTDLKMAVTLLAEQGITRLLIEAGAKLSTAFLQSGLVDRIYWFRAPVLIGNDGVSAAGNGFSAALNDITRWKCRDSIALSTDRLDIYEI